MNNGWQSRLKILRDTAERHILRPLRIHGWTGRIAQEVEKGDYIVIEATRGESKHRVALLYSSATDNFIYRQLDVQVDHFFIYGDLYELASFTRGISKPVKTANDFQELLEKWNIEGTIGRFAPGADAVLIDAKPERTKSIVSEQPLQAIWLRLRQIESVTLAEKLIFERAAEKSILLDKDTAKSKAEGLAFSVRNGADYFRAGQAQNVTQRVLNLYYGVMSFAFAEILASPQGPSSLVEIESKTKQGHGLFTLESDLEDIGQIAVGTLSQGFFPAWLKVLGVSVEDFPRERPRKYDELQSKSGSHWSTLEGLFGRIPEVSDFFSNIFKGPPGYVVPIYDSEANRSFSVHGNNATRPSKSYLKFYDRSALLRKEDIAKLTGPLSEIIEVSGNGSGRYFRAAVNFEGHNLHWDVLDIHQSPYIQSAMLLPIFKSLNQYRAICLVILYTLSIIVRYRPSVWRRVQEGDFDHLRAMIEAFLEVSERVLPEQFLSSINGRRLSVRQPSTW